MTIEISEETETQPTDEARRLGITVDALLRRLIAERAALTKPSPAHQQLPVWHLGTVSSLRRGDIYNDAG